MRDHYDGYVVELNTQAEKGEAVIFSSVHPQLLIRTLCLLCESVELRITMETFFFKCKQCCCFTMLHLVCTSRQCDVTIDNHSNQQERCLLEQGAEYFCHVASPDWNRTDILWNSFFSHTHTTA